MSKDVSTLIVIAFVVLLLGLMVAGWYARKRRQSHIGAPQQPPADLPGGHPSFTGKYVSTTLGGDQLNRVAVHSLGYRGNCSIEAHPTGIAIFRTGERDLWVPLHDLRGISRASMTIDRVVENNGLQVIEWNLDGTAVDSYFRMDDPEACEKALAGVMSNERQSHDL
ncbi:PH-like domain-containing protein [Salinibacterium sp. PAMC 21357]|uniref:PH-like domain-containing protein n=1 Tax=Salinibacterium sp. PAMC 21357 TaxID=1112215 RepID=UPI000287FF06|nr:membrane protein [Salinibacterium sp. PAMC 21357]